LDDEFDFILVSRLLSEVSYECRVPALRWMGRFKTTLASRHRPVLIHVLYEDIP
jgi:hypothetical protein